MSIALVVGDQAYVDTKLMKGKEAFAAFGKAMAFKRPIPVKFGEHSDILYGLVGAGPTEAIQGFRTLLEDALIAAENGTAPKAAARIDLDAVLEPYQGAHALGLVSAANMMDITLIGFVCNHLFTMDVDGPRIRALAKNAVLGGGSGGIIARRAMSEEGYTPLRAVFKGCYQDTFSGGVIEHWGLAWTVDQGDRIGFFSSLKFMHLGLSRERSSAQLLGIIAHSTEPMDTDLTSQHAIIWRRPADWHLAEHAPELNTLGQLDVKADPSTYTLPATVAPAALPAKKVKKPFIHTFFRRRLYKE